MLFLWKLFQLISLLLTLISFVVADFVPATPDLSNIVSFIVTTSSIYAFYTALLLRQLWRMPRIRDHYRQLPTRPERPVDTIGFLAYGSFSFRRQDLIGAGGMARVYKVGCTVELVCTQAQTQFHRLQPHPYFPRFPRSTPLPFARECTQARWLP